MPPLRRIRNSSKLEAFALSLLLALLIWFIHNMSQEYSDVVSVPVVVVTNIPGRTAQSAESSQVVARCRASGFYLVHKRLSSNGKPVRVKVAQEDLRWKDADFFLIDRQALPRYFHDIFGSGATLESFVSRDVQFRFPLENNVKLPIKAVSVLGFKPQYMALGDISLSQDSVIVYGDSLRLASLDAIYTQQINLNDLKGDVHGEVKLETPGGVRLSEDVVNYSLSVTRYVEFRRTVPVSVKNLPASVAFSYSPRRVSVVFRCVFPYDGKSLDRMRFYVDYNEFLTSINGKCAIRHTEKPACLIDFNPEPPTCECFQTADDSAR